MGSPDLAKDGISGIDAFYAFQRITSMTVTPQPNAVLIDFMTHLPTVPVVEIFRLVKEETTGKLIFNTNDMVRLGFDFLGAALGNFFTEHHARMDSLEQSTEYSYRITAGDGPRRAAVATGTFKTGRRTARVVFSSLEIWNDGDPGLKASGEMGFGAGFYEDIHLQSGNSSFGRSIESGEIVNHPFGAPPTFSNAKAPDWVAVYVLGQEHDGSSFGPSLAPPKRLPDAQFHQEEDNFVRADAFARFELPNDIGLHKINFILDSGPWGIHFKMNGWIDVNVTNPPPVFKKSLTTGALKSGTTLLGRVGARQSVHTPAGKAYTFALGPHGVIAQRLPRVRHRRRRDWALITSEGAESATLIACDEYHVTVVTVAAGTVRTTRRALDGADEAAPTWTVIGQDMQPALTALRLADGAVVLVGLTLQGEVRATLLRADGTRAMDWQALGGRFQGRVAALQEQQGVELFAVTERGEVQHLIWTAQAKKQAPWRAIGAGTVAHLVAVNDEGGSHLVAFTHQREVLALSRQGLAWGGDWRHLGTLDELGLEVRPLASAIEHDELDLPRRSLEAAEPSLE